MLLSPYYLTFLSVVGMAQKYKAAKAVPGLDLKDNRKVLNFIRHAEGMHNVVGEVDVTMYLLECNEDATLSPLGISQCRELNKNMIQNVKDESVYNIANSAQLVVISPMRRTLQTATYSCSHFIADVPW
jgi:broad specificity phosphatase PhoE